MKEKKEKLIGIISWNEEEKNWKLEF